MFFENVCLKLQKVNKMKKFLLSVTLSVLAFQAQAWESKCQNLYQLSDLDHAVEPGVIVAASADVPAHCQVRGVIDGSIRFEVSMPIEGWKGRMMFLAHGGNSGRIGDTKDLMSQGFAGATTDSGHVGTDNIEFIKNHSELINFGFRANHLTTVLAKKVIKAFYGKPVDYAYLQGCSGGGRSALMEALRFPDDYDGIITGAPTLGWIRATLPWAVGVVRKQKKNPLNVGSLALLAANSKQKCDGLDGLEDGLISNPQACTLDVLSLGDLKCHDGEAEGCLSSGQIETASFIYDGLRDENGEIVYNGIYPGDEGQGDWMMWVTGIPGQSMPAPGAPATAYESMAMVVSHLYHEVPGWKLEDFDPVRDQAELAGLAAPVELPAPDFTDFYESDGKMIIYHGWQDVPLRSRDTIDFLAEAATLSGGQEVMDEFLTTYMVPNMLHCAGGTGAWAADYVTPIVNWVESGEEPAGIVGTNPGISNWLEALALLEGGGGVNWYDNVMKATKDKDPATKSTRLLCPYPQVAKYKGAGDLKVASNYRCAESF